MLGEGAEKGELVPKEMERSYRQSALKNPLGCWDMGELLWDRATGTVSPPQSLIWPCLRGFMGKMSISKSPQGRMVVPKASCSP